MYYDTSEVNTIWCCGNLIVVININIIGIIIVITL